MYLSERGVVVPMILFGMVALLSGIGLFVYFQFYSLPKQGAITPLPTPAPSVLSSVVDFSSCVAAGNPVQESYPRKCSAGEKSFIEVISEASSSSSTLKDGWVLFRGNASNNQNPEAQFVVQYPNNWELDESIPGVGVVYPEGKGDDKPRIVLGAGGHGWYPELAVSRKQYHYGSVDYSWGKPNSLNFYVGYLSYSNKFSYILEASFIPIESESKYQQIFEEIGETLEVN